MLCVGTDRCRCTAYLEYFNSPYAFSEHRVRSSRRFHPCARGRGGRVRADSRCAIPAGSVRAHRPLQIVLGDLDPQETVDGLKSDLAEARRLADKPAAPGPVQLRWFGYL